MYSNKKYCPEFPKWQTANKEVIYLLAGYHFHHNLFRPPVFNVLQRSILKSNATTNINSLPDIRTPKICIELFYFRLIFHSRCLSRYVLHSSLPQSCGILPSAFLKSKRAPLRHRLRTISKCPFLEAR